MNTNLPLIGWGLSGWLLVATVNASEPLSKGHVLYHSDFGGTNLVVATATLNQIALPAEQLRGYTLRATARIKAENISAKPNPWNGIKLMLAIDAPGGKLWPQAEIGTGTFDWQRAEFTAKIPRNATAVTLCIGLENVTGKAWFDDVIVTVAKPPVTSTVLPVTGAPFTGHNEPRLRGVMIHPDIDAASLRVLGRDWKANLIRWQLIRNETSSDYDTWLETALKKLDVALPVCAEVGLRVVVDLHSPPGGKLILGAGYAGADDRLFTDKACQDKFVTTWQLIARRYRNDKTIWGYDLANEPIERLVAENCDDWPAMAERAAKAVRAIDPQRTIIVEPALGGGPEGLQDFVPLPVSNVVYSVHMYRPSEFTHQGVAHRPVGFQYPGTIAGQPFDKPQLEAALQPVVEFQKKYGVQIYIGEFSAIRWAPGNSAYRYLKDVIDIFESHGWDWSYHAFREWDGWSVEHGPEKDNHKPVTTPTDRQQLLCEWFARNR